MMHMRAKHVVREQDDLFLVEIGREALVERCKLVPKVSKESESVARRIWALGKGNTGVPHAQNVVRRRSYHMTARKRRLTELEGQRLRHKKCNDRRSAKRVKTRVSEVGEAEIRRESKGYGGEGEREVTEGAKGARKRVFWSWALRTRILTFSCRAARLRTCMTWSDR